MKEIKFTPWQSALLLFLMALFFVAAIYRYRSRVSPLPAIEKELSVPDIYKVESRSIDEIKAASREEFSIGMEETQSSVPDPGPPPSKPSRRQKIRPQQSEGAKEEEPEEFTITIE
ncbi:MAG TPA: hypothetical protein VJC03_01410 [bacterium]|nr:hypothetical protein [bacterium]